MDVKEENPAPMKPLLLTCLLSFLFLKDFREQQLQHERVLAAYADKMPLVLGTLKKHHLAINQLELYLRAFKEEQVLELWARNRGQASYQLIRSWPICVLSGQLGPKRREGDQQIPEGFYAIDGFNPQSRYHLSLHVNYPNPADQVLGYQPALGGLIYVHGDCVTIGCLPLTDEKIRELYVYCVEARNGGQPRIPLTIFPARLTAANLAKLKAAYAGDADRLNLWADLKLGYDYFEQKQQLPTVTFLPNGRHRVE